MTDEAKGKGILMFKDPLASREANEQAEKMINRKTIEIVQKLSDPQQEDLEFTSNLMDLCLLNKMVESHKN